MLHGVDLEVPASGLTALVGPSGTGKTTTFALIERYYDVDAGAVLVAGHDGVRGTAQRCAKGSATSSRRPRCWPAACATTSCSARRAQQSRSCVTS
ncbi:MAG: ATP-binding cassette domain-containing protein [Solirubrobacteraceae bacterium]